MKPVLHKESPDHLHGPGLQTLVCLDRLNQRMAKYKAFSLENQAVQPGSATGAGCYVKRHCGKHGLSLIGWNWRRRMVYLASGTPPNEEHGQPARKGGLIVRRVGPAEGQRPVAAAVARRPLHIAALARKRSLFHLCNYGHPGGSQGGLDGWCLR